VEEKQIPNRLKSVRDDKVKEFIRRSFHPAQLKLRPFEDT
jgi:hypothetical protein